MFTMSFTSVFHASQANGTNIIKLKDFLFVSHRKSFDFLLFLPKSGHLIVQNLLAPQIDIDVNAE